MLTSEAPPKPLTIPPKDFIEPPSEFFNPTLLMFLTAVAMIVISTCGYWLYSWQDWICFTINLLALHISGTVIHDACHKSAHRNPIINAIMGHGSALMLAFAFPVFTRVHLQHHSHVNDPENDPDYYVSTGGPLWLIPVRFWYHEIFFFKRRLWKKYELLEWFISRGIIVLLVCLGVHYHFLGYILNFWFVPTGIIGLALGLFFDYLPHRPHHETDRWKNARIYASPIMNILILGQNYHLVHHLWPSIPWYKYQPAYYLMKPLLDQKGSYQSLGLLRKKDFLEFLYDIFFGIRLKHHNHSETQPQPPQKLLPNDN
jgi:beta-carotene hydroxylase